MNLSLCFKNITWKIIELAIFLNEIIRLHFQRYNYSMERIVCSRKMSYNQMMTYNHYRACKYFCVFSNSSWKYWLTLFLKLKSFFVSIWAFTKNVLNIPYVYHCQVLVKIYVHVFIKRASTMCCAFFIVLFCTKYR